MRNFHQLKIASFATLIPAILLILLSWAPSAEAGKVYSFGVVPQFEASKLFSIWKPILRELERRSGISLQMIGSPKIPEFEKAFLSGKFDFAYVNPYHAVLAMRTHGTHSLVRDGGRSLSGVLVVGKNSAIKIVQDLAGQNVAFPAPNALGASLLMRAELSLLHGIITRPVYVQTHSSVYLHVVMGLADAGGGVMGTFNRQPENIRNELRIIYRTTKIAPHPVTAHPRVSQEVRERVRLAFLEIAKTKTGAALLAKVPIRKLIAATTKDYLELSRMGLENFYVKQN